MADEVTTLATQRVKHLLRDIATEPSVIIVFDGDTDNMRVYATGLDAEKLALVESMIESFNGTERMTWPRPTSEAPKD